MSDADVDVAVAGGGPVGLAAAIMARRAGLTVTVLEPREPPVDKACGEGLMPGAVRALAELGVDPPGLPLLGIRYVAAGRSASADFRGGPGRGVRRTVLHQTLDRTATAAGVTVLRRPVTTVSQDADGVVVDGLRARYLLAADGLHSPVRRMLGLDRPVRGPRRYGLRRHFEVPGWSDHVEVHWAPGAEAYVTPVGPCLVGVALLTGRGSSYDEVLARFPALGDRLREAAAGPVLGAGPLRQRSGRRALGRVLLVGDASGYVDALTGEGIAIGTLEARAAVAALAADRPADYEASWRRLTWRYRLLTQTLLGASRLSLVRRSIVPAAAALPRVFSAAVDELAGPT